MSRVSLLALNLIAVPLHQVIAVWGMRCVGYDFKFEKHLARSLKAIKTPSLGSAKKRKAITKDDNTSEGGDEQGGDSESGSSTPSKRPRLVKGKAKLVKYDWSGAKFQGDSEDEDYKPA